MINEPTPDTSTTPFEMATPDGIRWSLRQVAADGQGLYAPTAVIDTPSFVLASHGDLVELGGTRA